ncbi:MAG: TetR family transcriptional regulator [Pseudonocardiales bacterium]|nr:MAG: TetR family transcriptional regulator [Pseudonocardiales bacterium]
MKFTMSTLVLMTASGARGQQPYHHGDLRNALVQAAVGLAREGGPAAIVLREVARRVGVSPTAAYRHFNALPELIEAVADVSGAALARSMEAELGSCPQTDDPRQAAWDRMRAVGRGYVHFALAEPGLFTTTASRERRSAGGVGSARGGGGGERGASGLSPWDLLEQALDDMLSVGMLAAEDREAAAIAAWAAVHGLSYLLLDKLAALPSAEREAVIDATLDLVGRGLLVRD